VEDEQVQKKLTISEYLLNKLLLKSLQKRFFLNKKTFVHQKSFLKTFF